MILKTLETLVLNHGTVYPALLKLEQEGYIASEWGVSENNRTPSEVVVFIP
jgi:DNA-binding PadR family transcriptional regulator